MEPLRFALYCVGGVSPIIRVALLNWAIIQTSSLQAIHFSDVIGSGERSLKCAYKLHATAAAGT